MPILNTVLAPLQVAAQRGQILLLVSEEAKFDAWYLIISEVALGPTMIIFVALLYKKGPKVALNSAEEGDLLSMAAAAAKFSCAYASIA